MRSDPKIVEILNNILTNELTTINQYFLHARMLDHWGVTRFGKYEYKESIDEMRHSDWLIQRILFLDGLPNVQRLNPVLIGQTPEEILRSDLTQEERALTDLREGIAYCESVRDYASRDLLAKILEAEEEHVDFIERQFDLIGKIGVQNWIQLNSGHAGESGPD
jgi:bacterioferritin